MRFFAGVEANIFKLKDLKTNELSAKLDNPHGRDWSSLLVSKKIIDLLVANLSHNAQCHLGRRKKLRL